MYHALSLVSALWACSGEAPAPKPGVTAPPPSATPSAAVAPTPSPSPAVAAPSPAVPAAAVPEAAVPADLAQKYWVILQSDPDAAKVPPSISVIASHPELGVAPTRVGSTHFKNLMPCLHVVVAGAWAEQAQARALSKQLTALGVDNYVKNAGKFLRETPMLDQYCLAPKGKAGVGPAEGIVDSVGGGTWLQISLDPALYERAFETAGKSRPLGDNLGVWGRAIPAQTVGAWQVGARYDVVGAAGNRTSCTITGFEGLTVGTPHFGYVEAAGKAPDGPGCGEEAPFARLRCEAPVGPGVAFAEGKAPPSAVRGAALPAPVAAAARAALVGTPWWKEELEGLSGPPTSTDGATVAWTLGSRKFALTTIQLVAEGECGGVNDLVYVVHELGVDGSLGAVVLPPARVSWGKLLGLLDADGDGRPEVITLDFTKSLTVDGAAGDWAWEHPFCDCPC